MTFEDVPKGSLGQVREKGSHYFHLFTTNKTKHQDKHRNNINKTQNQTRIIKLKTTIPQLILSYF